MIWRLSNRFDKPAVALADRHYNRQKPGSPQMMPPGSCRVLVAKNERAVFGLSVPFPQYVRHAWPNAWNCSIFRNEAAGPLAHTMIRDALAYMRTQYDVPELGCVTFVDPEQVPGVPVRGALVKGFCFWKAGFELVGKTKSGKLAWLLPPSRMPSPQEIAT